MNSIRWARLRGRSRDLIHPTWEDAFWIGFWKSSPRDFITLSILAWKIPSFCSHWMSKRDPRDSSSFDSVFCCKAVPGVGGTDFAGVFDDKASKVRGWGHGGDVKRWSAVLSRSACEPEKGSTSWSPNSSTSSSFLDVSDFLFNVSLPMSNLYHLLFGEGSMDIAGWNEGDTGIISLASLPACWTKIMCIKGIAEMMTLKSLRFVFIALMRRHIENAIKTYNKKTSWSIQAWVERKPKTCK